MLSFFLKKKQSGDMHEDDIQGPSDSGPNNSADDFIFIEKKTNVNPVPQPLSHPMYPSMPYPVPPYPPQEARSTIANTNQTAVPYVQDVPFVLAPQLLVKNKSDLTQTQVDGVLAWLTRQISVDEKEEYNFALERSIHGECY